MSQKHEYELWFQISDAVLDTMMINHRNIFTCCFHLINVVNCDSEVRIQVGVAKATVHHVTHIGLFQLEFTVYVESTKAREKRNIESD